MKLKSYGDILVVSREEDDKITRSGIHLPDNLKKDCHFGTVVSGGPHVNDYSRILYNSAEAMRVEEFDLIHKQSVMAIVEE